GCRGAGAAGAAAAAAESRSSRRTRRARTSGETDTSPEHNLHALLTQAAEEPSLDPRAERNNAVRLLLMQNLRVAVQCCQQLPIAHRHADLRDWPQGLS